MTPTAVTQKPSLSVGIIGGGFMAQVHAIAARRAGAIVTGIAASRHESAIRAAERMRIPTAFSSADELIESADIDVVHICTPNVTHEGYASQALRLGKHVVCEKPLATSAEAAQRLVAEADAAGVVAAVPFVYRFHPMVREARARVRSGDLGRLFLIKGEYLQDWLASEDDDDWRVDSTLGGPSRAFADIGSHLCDLVEFVTGDRIARISAALSTVHANRLGRRVDTEDAAAVVVETQGGVVGTLLVSQVSAGRKNHLAFELSGSKENLVFEQETPDVLRIGRRDGFHVLPREAEYLHPEAAAYSTVPSGHPMGYQDAFNAFVGDVYRAIQGDTVDGLPEFRDGHRAALITEAVLESSRTSTWVETEES